MTRYIWQLTFTTSDIGRSHHFPPINTKLLPFPPLRTPHHTTPSHTTELHNTARLISNKELETIRYSISMSDACPDCLPYAHNYEYILLLYLLHTIHTLTQIHCNTNSLDRLQRHYFATPHSHHLLQQIKSYCPYQLVRTEEVYVPAKAPCPG